MLNYTVHAENASLYNTPPTFGIYILGLVDEVAAGRRAVSPAIGDVNERKAGKLYAEIDRTGFYRGTARHDSRVADERDVPAARPRISRRQFVKEATAAGLDGLKGHRSVGGMRASIYNAFPEDGVEALVAFMREFERKNG